MLPTAGTEGTGSRILKRPLPTPQGEWRQTGPGKGGEGVCECANQILHIQASLELRVHNQNSLQRSHKREFMFCIFCLKSEMEASRVPGARGVHSKRLVPERTVKTATRSVQNLWACTTRSLAKSYQLHVPSMALSWGTAVHQHHNITHPTFRAFQPAVRVQDMAPASPSGR